MGLEITLWIMGMGLVLTGWGWWGGRRPYEPGRLPLIPYAGLMFIGMVIVFVMAAHLITLVTGIELPGRQGLR